MPDLSRWLGDPPTPPPSVTPAAEPVPVVEREPASTFHDETATADQLLAILLARNPKPDWKAEHVAAVELVARACPTERETDRMRRRRSARSLVGFKPVADLDRQELARDTLALLLAVPAVAAGGMVLWTDYADQAELALEAARATLGKPRAGESAGTSRAA